MKIKIQQNSLYVFFFPHTYIYIKSLGILGRKNHVQWKLHFLLVAVIFFGLVYSMDVLNTKIQKNFINFHSMFSCIFGCNIHFSSNYTMKIHWKYFINFLFLSIKSSCTNWKIDHELFSLLSLSLLLYTYYLLTTHYKIISLIKKNHKHYR